MRAAPVQNLLLDLSALSDADGIAWRAWLDAALATLELAPSVQAFTGAPPDDGEAFAFVADSAGLSRKLLLNVPRIYVQPSRAPHLVDALVWLLTSPESEVLEAFWPKVSLITSVFRGDGFLPGFLANMAALEGYAGSEHWLIRAASPGLEHEALIGHVRHHPGAVYVNLPQDPGLYGVWNLGLRLASGCFVSNANLDDRRSPRHLSCLQAVLQQYPEVAAASTPLYISTEKNLDWHQAAQRGNCPRLFADEREYLYGLKDLFQQTPQGGASRNLPHCMPLWRRGVHCWAGEFDEARYGPSADWAFWLKTAALGARFHIGVEPLGLYLRDEGSYWRRNHENQDFDRRIVDEFSQEMVSVKAVAFAPGWRAVGQELVAAVDLLRDRAALEGIGRLLQAGRRLVPDAAAARDLVDAACWRFLGCRDGWAWLAGQGAGAGLHGLGTLGVADDVATSALFNALVDLVQVFDVQVAASVARRNLVLACCDWQACFADGRGLLLLARLAGRCGDAGLESALLQRCFQADRLKFWYEVQQVYRFTRALPDLCAAVGVLGAVGNGAAWSAVRPGRAAQMCRVAFYPEYSNQYQNLLYAPLRTAGGFAIGFKRFESFVEMNVDANILHVHWLNQIFGNRALSAEQMAERAEAFLVFLRQRQAAGCEVLWTIHNELSHDTVDAAAETAFHRALYQLADRVFVHHPSVLALLDWLPENERGGDKGKLSLCEHGAYDPAALTISRQQARRALGFADDEWLLAYIGQMRDYKGLDALLPTLLAQLDALPRMRVLLAGKVQSAVLRDWLATHAHPRLMVLDAHLDDVTLVNVMRAADVGLLAYRTILTSGSLFHWLSCGRPVLAPALGTIPAYVVNDWNGWLYNDAVGLGNTLRYAAGLTGNMQLCMEQNAQYTAQQLDWRMWQ